METVNLKFKKLGYYAEGKSARYEAIVNDNFTVRVEAIFGYYGDGFTFTFITKSGYCLERLSSNYLSNFWDKSTKTDCVKFVSGILNDKECFDEINKEAISLEKYMYEYYNKPKI